MESQSGRIIAREFLEKKCITSKIATLLYFIHKLVLANVDAVSGRKAVNLVVNQIFYQFFLRTDQKNITNKELRVWVCVFAAPTCSFHPISRRFGVKFKHCGL